jgi:GntR family transcriptional regulator
MILTINVDDPRSIYEQVADGIRQMIAKGTLAEGSPLPPVRQLAADLGVNMNTIATAYRELQKDGLITVKHGTGSVVSSRTSSNRNKTELLSPLQSALTQLVLAGWPRSRILEAVAQELETVGRVGK